MPQKKMVRGLNPENLLMNSHGIRNELPEIVLIVNDNP